MLNPNITMKMWISKMFWKIVRFLQRHLYSKFSMKRATNCYMSALFEWVCERVTNVVINNIHKCSCLIKKIVNIRGQNMVGPQANHPQNFWGPGPHNVKTKGPYARPKWRLKMLAHFNTSCIKDTRNDKSGPEKKMKALKLLLPQMALE